MNSLSLCNFIFTSNLEQFWVGVGGFVPSEHKSLSELKKERISKMPLISLDDINYGCLGLSHQITKTYLLCPLY